MRASVCVCGGLVYACLCACVCAYAHMCDLV